MSNLNTVIARQQDRLLLVTSQDHIGESKKSSDFVLKQIQYQRQTEGTLAGLGDLHFHFLISGGVIFLCSTDNSYPRNLAHGYLQDLSRAFLVEYGNSVRSFNRPYAAVAFDPIISRLRLEYVDPKDPTNIKKLNRELQETREIMFRNIQDVMERGEKLNKMQSRAHSLRSQSKKFKSMSRWVNLRAQLQQYAPCIAIAVAVLVFVYFKYYWFADATAVEEAAEE